MPGVSLGITLPTVGVTVGTDYATDINSALTSIINDIEALIVPGEIDMSADLDFQSAAGTSYGADNLAFAHFENRTANASDNRTLFFKSGDLYCLDNDGNSIQITSGGSLNLSATGQITGSGYGTGGVEVNWDSGNTKYKMKSGSGSDDYGDVECAAVRMNDGSSHFFDLGAPSLAADVTATLPSALPGQAEVLTINASGEIEPASTNPPAEVQHGNVVKLIPASMGVISGSALTIDGNDGVTVNTTVLFIPIPLLVGDRVKSVVVWYTRTSGTGAFDLYRTQNSTGTDTDLGGGASVTSGTSRTSSTVNVTDTTLSAGDYLLFRCDMLTSTGNFVVHSIEVTYDHP